MPIRVLRGSVRIAEDSIPFRQLPALLSSHLEIVANTEDLEEFGRELREQDFPGDDLGEFIRGVCRWGGWAGIAGRVRRDNTPEHVRDAFREAETHLQKEPDLSKALGAINRIKGLGKPSYASKHLRFLHPDRCPILDNMVAEDLGYDYDVDGYAKLAADLAALADALEDTKVANPLDRPAGRWYAGDLDMALFAWVRRQRGQW